MSFWSFMSLNSKKIVLRAFLYKISSKPKKFKTNFEDKTSLIKSASEDENNVSEKSETSDDEYLFDFTKLQPYMNHVSKESLEENCPGKESSDSKEDMSKIGNTL